MDFSTHSTRQPKIYLVLQAFTADKFTKMTSLHILDLLLNHTAALVLSSSYLLFLQLLTNSAR